MRERVIVRGILVTGYLIASLLIAPAPDTFAAFTDHFDALRATLEDRVSVLDGTSGTQAQVQKRACIRAITLIDDDSGSLREDLLTARIVSGRLVRVFRDEFSADFGSAGSLPGDLGFLLGDMCDAFTADVEAALAALKDSTAGLPGSDRKVRALKKVAAARSRINDANHSSIYPRRAALLGSAMLLIEQGERIIRVDPPPPGLRVSDAVPSSGNGQVNINSVTTMPLPLFDLVTISGKNVGGGVSHVIVVLFETATGNVAAVFHKWLGTNTGGSTVCSPDTSPCDPSQVRIDIDERKIIFSGLELENADDESEEDDQSTLQGTVSYPAPPSIP